MSNHIVVKDRSGQLRCFDPARATHHYTYSGPDEGDPCQHLYGLANGAWYLHKKLPPSPGHFTLDVPFGVPLTDEEALVWILGTGGDPPENLMPLIRGMDAAAEPAPKKIPTLVRQNSGPWLQVLSDEEAAKIIRENGDEEAARRVLESGSALPPDQTDEPLVAHLPATIASQQKPNTAIAGTEPGTAKGNSIRRDGAVWKICYGAEQGSYPVKDYTALATVAQLLANPHHTFQFIDLVDADARLLLERPESRAEILDQPAIANLKRRYEQLQRERANQNDPLVVQENETELAAITAQLKNALGPGRRKRKLGRTPADQAWDALTKNLRRLWPRLRTTGMPELATHLESSICIDHPQIGYLPPANTPLWDVGEVNPCTDT